MRPSADTSIQSTVLPLAVRASLGMLPSNVSAAAFLPLRPRSTRCTALAARSTAAGEAAQRHSRQVKRVQMVPLALQQGGDRRDRVDSKHNLTRGLRLDDHLPELLKLLGGELRQLARERQRADELAACILGDYGMGVERAIIAATARLIEHTLQLIGPDRLAL